MIPISRIEAIKLAKVIQQRAEIERREATERDAREGLQYDEPAASPWRIDEPSADGIILLHLKHKGYRLCYFWRNHYHDIWSEEIVERNDIIAWSQINSYKGENKNE